MTRPPVTFRPKSAYVLPDLPPDLGVDPLFAIVLHSVAFLELSDDETLDPDDAVEALESITSYMSRLPEELRERYREQSRIVARYLRDCEQPDEVVDVVERLFEQMGLDDLVIRTAILSPWNHA